MRERMMRLRVKLAKPSAQRSNSKDFDFIAEHTRHVFAARPARGRRRTSEADDGIYMIDDSRINVAGIPEDRIGELADALLAAIR